MKFYTQKIKSRSLGSCPKGRDCSGTLVCEVEEVENPGWALKPSSGSVSFRTLVPLGLEESGQDVVAGFEPRGKVSSPSMGSSPNGNQPTEGFDVVAFLPSSVDGVGEATALISLLIGSVVSADRCRFGSGLSRADDRRVSLCRTVERLDVVVVLG